MDTVEIFLPDRANACLAIVMQDSGEWHITFLCVSFNVPCLAAKAHWYQSKLYGIIDESRVYTVF